MTNGSRWTPWRLNVTRDGEGVTEQRIKAEATAAEASSGIGTTKAQKSIDDYER
ncbi:hypothetical protein PC128_g18790 [Phytophthora cactorum]|nr:hypothetical protein PC128_g18790 [Phytophthora cactorum]